MWRAIAIFLLGGMCGTAFGIAAGLYIHPWVLPPPKTTETLRSERQAVAHGTFIHADPSDSAHYGKGGVAVHEDTVFLKPDFEVGPGPAYRVYLVAKERVRESADVRNSTFVDLGRLRSFSGSQNYPIPGGVNPRDYRSVVIWCVDFSVLISPADLVF